MPIKDWPRLERPRERLLEQGEEALSDAELLALFLGSGPAGLSAVDLARQLLTQFGSLRELLSADRKRLLAINGMGPARYALLQAALALGKRCHLTTLSKGPGLHGTKSTCDFLVTQLLDHPYEVLCALYLDTRRRLIAFEEWVRGPIDRATVHPREIVRQVLEHNAAAVILAHYCPSGVAERSPADELISRLKEALALVGVRMLDHVVLQDGQCKSFLEHGLLR